MLLGAFVGPKIRALTPRAAMLGSLAGTALVATPLSGCSFFDPTVHGSAARDLPRPSPTPEQATTARSSTTTAAIRAASPDAARDLVRSGGRPPATRIGVNTGPVLIGNIGSPRRFNYTAMGDAVNLGSRLEGITKQYGADIIIGEATQARLSGFVCREIDRVRVKGKEEAITIYEPLGLESEVTDDQREEIAQRQRTEAALRESEARFRAMADSAPVLMWVADPELRRPVLLRVVQVARQVEDEALADGGLDETPGGIRLAGPRIVLQFLNAGRGGRRRGSARTRAPGAAYRRAAPAPDPRGPASSRGSAARRRDERPA